MIDLNLLASEDDEGNSVLDLNVPASEVDDADDVFDFNEPKTTTPKTPTACLMSTSNQTTTPTTCSISTRQKITTEVMHHFVLSFRCLFRLFTVLIIVYFSLQYLI
jgi:hypothetical protein